MKQVLYFLGGALVGGGLGYFLTKRYYENLIDEEVESVKESYKETLAMADELIEKRKFERKANTLGYLTPDQAKELVDEDEEYEEADGLDENPFPGEPSGVPYTIDPDEFSNSSLFDKETITYYAGNDVAVTDEDEVIEIGYLGRENLGKFGEYEPDVVYVRNEKMGMDFEIVFVDGEYEPAD